MDRGSSSNRPQGTVWLVALAIAAANLACSTCSGTPFVVRDGAERFPVPGLGPEVTLIIPDITTQGASAQRARDIFVYDGDREIARSSEVYEGQAVRFSRGGRSYRVEVTEYIEHLLNADEARLCVVAE